VYDSLAGAPLSDASVQAVLRDDPRVVRTARTDSLGRFVLDSLAAARHVLGFLHPALESLRALGVDVRPVLVDLTAGASGDIALAVPGPVSLRAVLCPAPAAGDSSGALGGVVRDALSGAPVPGAVVTVTWIELAVSRQGLRREPQRVPAAVRADGRFVVCGLPADALVEIEAHAPGRAVDPIEVTVPARGLAIQDLALGARAAAGPATAGAVRGAHGDPPVGRADMATGPARLTGVVVDAAGRPLAGVQVRVPGTAAHARTDSTGRFALGGLPAGTVMVEARAIGLALLRRPVTLRLDGPQSIRLAMTDAAVVLDRVVVRATRTEAFLASSGFAQRRATKAGRYFGPEDIARERRLVQHATDYVRRLQGRLRVVPSGASDWALRGPRDCVPRVWLDGFAIHPDDLNALAPAAAVAAVEVYDKGSHIPVSMQADGRGRSVSGFVHCGAVVVWTRR
jgi:hypothetical protein